MQIRLRVYTKLFAKNIMKMYETWRERPWTERADVRGRKHVDFKNYSDKELFGQMATGDLWLETGVHKVYMYLYECKYVQRLPFKSRSPL